MMQPKPGNTQKRHASFKGKKTGTKKQQKKLTIAKVKCRAWCRAWSRDLVEKTGIAESTDSVQNDVVIVSLLKKSVVIASNKSRLIIDL